MTIKVGINGFGRIGRLALRAAWGWPELEFVQVNDPAGDAATHAHLLNFDSVHGRWQHEASHAGECIVIDGKSIKVTANKAIADTDWSGCDLVIEASGKMKTVAVLQGLLVVAQRLGLVPQGRVHDTDVVECGGLVRAVPPLLFQQQGLLVVT